MVVYVGFLAAGSAAGPIVAGAIASGSNSWRWFFRVTSITIGINIITCILMLPETTHVTDEQAPESSLSVVGDDKQADTCVENSTGCGDGMQVQSLGRVWLERSFYGRPIYATKRQSPVKLFLAPFPLLLAPPVLLTTIVFGLTIGWTALVSIVVSNVFSAPPKLWQPYQVGLINFGPLIGLLIGLPLGGLLTDLLSKSAMKRSNGEHDPRSRLPAVILGGLISPAGCILIGFALQDELHWTLVAVGWGMLAFGLTASANVLLTYSVDCFRLQAGHVGVLVNVVKNSIGFGVSFASMPWFYQVGPAKQFGAMAGLSWGAYLLVVPVWIWSRSLVGWSQRILHL
jgi:MFS family permease